ncbi:MAG: peptidoglycan-binding domain-containing protein [Aulosira sp. ZfuVER01]|nr:peptidoglycan-binding domain-containing protein [Aulosira sp. ZfuVER01]MDZ8002295.1 peptidoglycan-binding domain-containing protein [Aulosira sp. DedVER01a]MDZ8052701.1 peptidoglycan-binding domain-containing protein [Aulosira sp. ZfuCHP01]
MNWKLLAVIPMLTLATAVPAYSQMTNKSPNTTNHTQVTQPKVSATKKTNVAKKPTTKANQTIALRLGSQGQSVKVAQDFLKKQGLYTGNVNGVFNKETRSAVMKFQKSKGLKADGIIGRRTLAAMK